MEYIQARRGYYAVRSYGELAAGCSIPEPVQHPPGAGPQAAQPGVPLPRACAPRPSAEPAPLTSPPVLFSGCFLWCWQPNQLLWRSASAKAGTEREHSRSSRYGEGQPPFWGAGGRLSWYGTSSRHPSQDEDLLIGRCTTLTVHTNRSILIVLQEPVYLISFQKVQTTFLLIGQ